MTIGKRTLGVLCTAATTVAVIGLGAVPALASTTATTLTVTVSGGGSYTATTAKTVLSDNGINVTCTTKGKTAASTGSGKIPNGTGKGPSPVAVGTVAKLAFNNCVGPLGKVSTTIKSTPYTVSVDSKTNTSGETAGMISGVKVAVKMKGCSFMVTGSAPGYYANGKHTLNLTPKLPLKALDKAQLSVSGVSGCFGLVKNGDHPTYVGAYTLSRKGTIKSS
jgi:hypothetical protein